MAISSPAEELFKGLNTYAEIQRLIDTGETEGLYLECKSPQAPNLNNQLRNQLAEAISGFSNTGGGVILWGVSTTRHAHSDLDVLSQIEPVANCRNFAKQIDKHIPLLSTPSVRTLPSTVLLENARDTRGVVATLIPPSQGDPIQCNLTRGFYFRNSDTFSVLPYEILRRMFSSGQAPELAPSFNEELVRLEADGSWTFPLVIRNESSTAADQGTIAIAVLNWDSCERFVASGFDDVSSINPGKHLFLQAFTAPVHRGLNINFGNLRVVMKRGKRGQLPRRTLKLRVDIYANRMRAKSWSFTIQLAKKQFKVTTLKEEYLY